ncbi:hypothetical protein HZI73_06780 [Vallitalea pronyensis]|uniref:Uncharacterized protein n=1 Tax=Vallitalea pronyensis TaxID=1348613 RepID=A0A8J8MI47_9FIRM|nr:hypothetical protein [Vallitalea pronyensis]QUI22024.1 hypothetical protein HZI73_06780 [Vallitalea pronyensis]
MNKNITNIDRDYYKAYLDALIKGSEEAIDNDLIYPIALDDFINNSRSRFLSERKYEELASMYQLIGMHYRNMNELFFNNYLTCNYHANTLINVGCYYYKYIHNEYASILAQYNASFQKSIIAQYKNTDPKFAYIYAMNIELLGDVYLLIDHDEALKYYNQAKELYEKDDHYGQLSYNNDLWCSYALKEMSIVLSECYHTELSLDVIGIERIKQKNKLFEIIN